MRAEFVVRLWYITSTLQARGYTLKRVLFCIKLKTLYSMVQFIVNNRSGVDSKTLVLSSLKECSSIPICRKPRRKKQNTFQDNWGKEFLVVNNDGNTGLICPVCHASLLGFQESKLSKTYCTHSVFGKGYPMGSNARVYEID